jgi:hypothetical protein
VRLVLLYGPLVLVGFAAGALRALSLRASLPPRRRRALQAGWVLLLLAGVPLWLVLSTLLRARPAAPDVQRSTVEMPKRSFRATGSGEPGYPALEAEERPKPPPPPPGYWPGRTAGVPAVPPRRPGEDAEPLPPPPPPKAPPAKKP